MQSRKYNSIYFDTNTWRSLQSLYYMGSSWPSDPAIVIIDSGNGLVPINGTKPLPESVMIYCQIKAGSYLYPGISELNFWKCGHQCQVTWRNAFAWKFRISSKTVVHPHNISRPWNWLPFCRWFSWKKKLYFYSNFNDVSSYGFNWHYLSTGLGNGF